MLQGLNWIELSENRGQLWTLVNAIIILCLKMAEFSCLADRLSASREQF
jgi:hypothetical protein